MREKACPGIGDRGTIKNGRGKVCVLMWRWETRESGWYK